MDLALAFDIVVACLLIVTIVYAVILNRKLAVLRAAKGDMERVLNGFAQATVQAERGMAAVRDAADGAAGDLRKQIESGRGLMGDLSFMVERAGELADRLDGAITSSRPAAKRKAGSGGAARMLDGAGKGAARAAGMATAAIAPDAESEGALSEPISSKQAAFLKALRSIR